MSLQLGSALRSGATSLLSRTGAILLGSYVVLMAMLGTVSNSLIVGLYRQAGLAEVADAVPLLLDVSVPVAAGLYLLGVVLASYHSLVSVRTFVAGATDAFPDGALTRNVPLALVNLFVGGLVYGLLVFLGTVALVVPGIIAYVAFLFMVPYVAVEDRNFVDALRSSYRLSKGNWLLLFVLVVILVSISAAIGGVAGVVFALVLPPLANQFAIVFLQAPASLYVLAVIAAAFNQLRDADGDTGSAGAAPNAETPSTPI